MWRAFCFLGIVFEGRVTQEGREIPRAARDDNLLFDG
jgi:hypothetical protein